MGWFDGFPFKSKDQMERERKEFEQRVFPLGMEQRDHSLVVLRQVMNPKLRDEEMLFAFISAKDTYKLHEDPEEGLARARAKLHKQNRLKPPDVAAVLALVQLDDAAETLAAYPDAEAVRKAVVLLD